MQRPLLRNFRTDICTRPLARYESDVCTRYMIDFVRQFCSCSCPTAIANMSDLSQALAEEIKEFHFHVYFFPNDPASRESAHKLRQKISTLSKQGFFHPVPDSVSSLRDQAVGPHPMPMFAVWCPKEYFSRMFTWFMLNHGEHSVLVHSLTKEELKDHTERAAWIGKPVPLNTSRLESMLAELPASYQELGLGYSSPTG